MKAKGPPYSLLLCIDELDVGGTEQQILELVRGLDPSEFQPQVCCFRPGRIAREIAASGVPVAVLRKRRRIDPVVVARLAELMRSRRAVLVHTFLFTANTWGRLAALLARAPVVVASERNVDMWPQRYKRWLGRLLARPTARIVANAEAVRSYLLGQGIPPAKVVTIYNGVNLARCRSLKPREATRRTLGVAADAPLVVSVARLEPQKGLDLVLEAASSLRASHPTLRVAVVGGGPEADRLRRQAQEMGLDGRVVFTGPRDDVLDVMSAADVCLLASHREGMPNVLLEAMAVGCPVVATAVGGNPEVVAHGRTGLLVPPRRPDALVEATHRLLEQEGLRRRLGAAGRARVAEHFSVERMVESTTSLYRDLVGLPRPAAQERAAVAVCR